MIGGAVGTVEVADGSHALSREQIFETLSNRRRRHVLHALKRNGEPVAVRELSEVIAGWENGIDRAAVTPKQRKRVYTALHQTHLPAMDRVGVVVYDRDRKVVSLTEEVAAFDIYLDITPRDSINWAELYLGVAGVCVAIVVVAALGVYPFSLLPGFGYALLVAVAVLVTAAVHTYSIRSTRLGGSEQPPDAAEAAD